MAPPKKVVPLRPGNHKPPLAHPQNGENGGGLDPGHSLLPPDAGLPRMQRGVDQVFTPRVSRETLVKMDHAEWLESFAKIMQLKTGVEMTPMRAGVISRCSLAAEFIRLMKVDQRVALQKVADLTAEITRLKKRTPDA